MPIPDNIIQRAADCNIKQFKKCSFEEKYKVLLIDGEASDEDLRNAFEYIYAEYVDLSELFISQEFEMVAYINSLDNRIQFMRRWIELQRKFIFNFKCPYIKSFFMVKKYGHNVYYDWDQPEQKRNDAFLQKLAKMELGEKKNDLMVAKKVDELMALRKKKVAKIHTILESRKSFISMLNRLRQAHFVIEDDKTSVEDLALMIKDYRDQVEEAKSEKLKKRF